MGLLTPCCLGPGCGYPAPFSLLSESGPAPVGSQCQALAGAHGDTASSPRQCQETQSQVPAHPCTTCRKQPCPLARATPRMQPCQPAHALKSQETQTCQCLWGHSVKPLLAPSRMQCQALTSPQCCTGFPSPGVPPYGIGTTQDSPSAPPGQVPAGTLKDAASSPRPPVHTCCAHSLLVIGHYGVTASPPQAFYYIGWEMVA